MLDLKDPAQVRRRRTLPIPAAAALDIIVAGGSREMRANDFELKMHQRGFNSRDVGWAIKAFERRGWLVQSGRVIEINDEAFNAKPAARKALPPLNKKRTRLPPGLFGG